MKKLHVLTGTLIFILSLAVISGCNTDRRNLGAENMNENREENRNEKTPSPVKVVNTENGRITGEPVSYNTDRMSIKARSSRVPNNNMMNTPQDYNMNTNMNTNLNTINNPDTGQMAPWVPAPPPSDVNGDSLIQQVVQLTNEQRRQNGLPGLQMDAELSNMAQTKARDMLDNHYFSHTSPTYGSPFEMMKRFGISYTSAGENIAQGQQTAEQVVSDWMNSPGHRANILNSRFTHIGVGHTTSEGYWTQEFIGR
ncbi:CAP domain-containing protein [Bacillus songklensis]|uniref:CAP domain-containing protein n=1 Tax=Bacillus songklensis TaxID=1069116 RepID=A0ABV8B8H5_9BACI